MSIFRYFVAYYLVCNVLANIEIIKQNGHSIGYLNDISRKDKIKTLIEKAKTLLIDNSIIIKSSSYFKHKGRNIDELRDAEKDISIFNIDPEIATQIVFCEYCDAPLTS